MIKVIAFDPGVTTGFAMGEITEVEGDILDGTLVGQMLVQTAQAEFTKAELFTYLNTIAPNHIVCESFEYRNQARTGLILESRELIGIINLYVELNPPCTLKMQPPGMVIGKTAYYTDARLKLSGIYRRGQIHANEAAKHLLYWFKFGPGFKYNKAGFKLKQAVTENSPGGE
jgi:hypothetical protein